MRALVNYLIVQRLFSMFPDGAPGIALVLLRISVAASFLWCMSIHRHLDWFYLLFAMTLVIASSVSIGFLTPLLSGVVCIAAMVNVAASSPHFQLVSLGCTLNAAALALLGPGAYSLDARLFGRRVIAVNPRNNADEF